MLFRSDEVEQKCVAQRAGGLPMFLTKADRRGVLFFFVLSWRAICCPVEISLFSIARIANPLINVQMKLRVILGSSFLPKGSRNAKCKKLKKGGFPMLNVGDDRWGMVFKGDQSTKFGKRRGRSSEGSR